MLESMAAQFHLSEPYISKYIKDKSGKTFGEHVAHIRMKRAKTLLKNGNMTVENIADVVAVSNTIKQFFGISYELSTYEEHALSHGSSSKAIAYVGITCEGKNYWGVGMDEDIIKRSVERRVGTECRSRWTPYN